MRSSTKGMTASLNKVHAMQKKLTGIIRSGYGDRAADPTHFDQDYSDWNIHSIARDLNFKRESFGRKFPPTTPTQQRAFEQIKSTIDQMLNEVTKSGKSADPLTQLDEAIDELHQRVTKGLASSYGKVIRFLEDAVKVMSRDPVFEPDMGRLIQHAERARSMSPGDLAETLRGFKVNLQYREKESPTTYRKVVLLLDQAIKEIAS